MQHRLLEWLPNKYLKMTWRKNPNLLSVLSGHSRKTYSFLTSALDKSQWPTPRSLLDKRLRGSTGLSGLRRTESPLHLTRIELQFLGISACRTVYLPFTLSLSSVLSTNPELRSWLEYNHEYPHSGYFISWQKLKRDTRIPAVGPSNSK
jgi:hypothetical protein